MTGRDTLKAQRSLHLGRPPPPSQPRKRSQEEIGEGFVVCLSAVAHRKAAQGGEINGGRRRGLRASHDADLVGQLHAGAEQAEQN